MPNSFYDTLSLASIGSGFPMALGVQMALPHRPVISTSGVTWASS